MVEKVSKDLSNCEISIFRWRKRVLRSSCALLAEYLAGQKKDITIITNSAFIARHIRESAAGKTVLLGGDYQKESEVMVGPLVRKCAREFYVDKFFMGTDSFCRRDLHAVI